MAWCLVKYRDNFIFTLLMDGWMDGWTDRRTKEKQENKRERKCRRGTNNSLIRSRILVTTYTYFHCVPASVAIFPYQAGAGGRVKKMGKNLVMY
jgi:hypothetical protein